MNSQVWQVRQHRQRWALKVVADRDRPTFQAGLLAATAVDDGGLAAGRPVATTSGDLSVELSGGCAALLKWIDGVQLTGGGNDATIIGATLGHAHRLLSGLSGADAPGFDRLDLQAAHLEVEQWIRPAISSVLDEWQRVRPLVTTWGLLHADPAPEAFLRQADGSVALVDWASCLHGPLLFDLASALMYLGSDDLLNSYLHSGVLAEAELEAGLEPMLRMRWAVQADYFARRVFETDLTGVESRAENLTGLTDARRALGLV